MRPCGFCAGFDQCAVSRAYRRKPQVAGKIKTGIPPFARGAIAQLGERIVRNDEVVGSIPTSSTIISTTSDAFLKISFNFGPFYWNTNGTSGTCCST